MLQAYYGRRRRRTDSSPSPAPLPRCLTKALVAGVARRPELSFRRHSWSARTPVCRACPRLVEWREDVAVSKRKSFADQPYWGRPIPGWGAAEAYMWLGRCYLGKGDVLPARDALERALLIAPEFAQARRLLSSITSG